MKPHGKPVNPSGTSWKTAGLPFQCSFHCKTLRWLSILLSHPNFIVNRVDSVNNARPPVFPSKRRPSPVLQKEPEMEPESPPVKNRTIEASIPRAHGDVSRTRRREDWQDVLQFSGLPPLRLHWGALFRLLGLRGARSTPARSARLPIEHPFASIAIAIAVSLEAGTRKPVFQETIF